MHGADADAVQESGRLLSACVGFLRAWRRRPTFGWFMDFWGVISSNAMATSGHEDPFATRMSSQGCCAEELRARKLLEDQSVGYDQMCVGWKQCILAMQDEIKLPTTLCPSLLKVDQALKAMEKGPTLLESLHKAKIPESGKGKDEKGTKGKGTGKEPEKPYMVGSEVVAGIELMPTCWGMRLDKVEDKPGQPHLEAGSTITAIDGQAAEKQKQRQRDQEAIHMVVRQSLERLRLEEEERLAWQAYEQQMQAYMQQFAMQQVMYANQQMQQPTECWGGCGGCGGCGCGCGCGGIPYGQPMPLWMSAFRPCTYYVG
ncbi:Upf1, partial [Symbiodinium natans]